jgi:hypothetical protein
MTRSQELAKQYASQNEQSAAIILADVARFGGEQAALVVWARVAIASPKDSEAGSLFRESKPRPESVSKASRATTNP